MKRERIAAIVLAAGTSSRYGANKLLLPFGDSSVIRTAAQRILAAQPECTVVVTGHDSEHVRAQLAGLPLTLAHNPRYLEGEMISSIKVGLAALEATPVAAALVALGDMPLLPTEIVLRLMRAYRLCCGELLAPRFEQQRGHPVVIARRFWPAALALPDGAPMRQLLAAHPDAVALLQVNTDRILRDVDTPALYDEALVAAGRR
jgi:molybdenum cofactor cytidylyltransferase